MGHSASRRVSSQDTSALFVTLEFWRLRCFEGRFLRQLGLLEHAKGITHPSDFERLKYNSFFLSWKFFVVVVVAIKAHASVQLIPSKIICAMHLHILVLCVMACTACNTSP